MVYMNIMCIHVCTCTFSYYVIIHGVPSFNYLQLVNQPEVKVDGCDICKKVVEAAQSFLLSNTTEVHRCTYKSNLISIYTASLHYYVPFKQHDNITVPPSTIQYCYTPSPTMQCCFAPLQHCNIAMPPLQYNISVPPSPQYNHKVLSHLL